MPYLDSLSFNHLLWLVPIFFTLHNLGGFLVTYFGVDYLANQTGYLIVLELQAILLFHAFFPQIASTIRFRMYSPGVQKSKSH